MQPEPAAPVLVVDDQRPFRVAARAVLARAGGFVVVGEAESGERAVELAAELRPALVLMDVRLPGISGVEAAAGIRARVPDAVVLLCSTHARCDLPPDVASSGSAYLSKEDLSPELVRRLWRDARAGAGR